MIFYAVPDHPWSDAGAAVRIAMTGVKTRHFNFLCQYGLIEFESEETAPEDSAESLILKWSIVENISSALRFDADISQTKSIEGNKGLASRGMQLIGSGFCLLENEKFNVEPEAIQPYLNGRDLMQSPRNSFVMDFFGLNESQVASLYPKAYQWILERVKPERDQNNRDSYRKKWWIFGEPRIKLRDSLHGIARYIATVETAKHRVFVFLDKQVVPDNMLIAIALEDAYFLGVLSSKIHVTWALAAGGTLEDRPRYNKTVCFDPFPFPDPDDRLKQEIRELGERLDSHRKTVQANHPDITITGMYNLLEKLRAGQPFTDKDRELNDRALVSTLKQIHDDLDRAVFRAYGWDDLIPQWERAHGGAPLPEEPANSLDEQILERLVKLNAERTAEERNGHIRWLRPDYQAPATQTTQTAIANLIDSPEPIAPAAEPQPWPTQPKAQLAAIRDLLRSNPGNWSIEQIAAQFKGKITDKRRQTIRENLDRLEWFGLAIQHENTWHHAAPSPIA